jgi:hypothetical protein
MSAHRDLNKDPGPLSAVASPSEAQKFLHGITAQKGPLCAGLEVWFRPKSAVEPFEPLPESGHAFMLRV